MIKFKNSKEVALAFTITSISKIINAEEKEVSSRYSTHLDKLTVVQLQHLVRDIQKEDTIKEIDHLIKNNN